MGNRGGRCCGSLPSEGRCRRRARSASRSVLAARVSPISPTTTDTRGWSSGRPATWASSPRTSCSTPATFSTTTRSSQVRRPIEERRARSRRQAQPPKRRRVAVGAGSSPRPRRSGIRPFCLESGAGQKDDVPGNDLVIPALSRRTRGEPRGSSGPAGMRRTLRGMTEGSYHRPKRLSLGGRSFQPSVATPR